MNLLTIIKNKQIIVYFEILISKNRIYNAIILTSIDVIMYNIDSYRYERCLLWKIFVAYLER